MKMFGSGDRRPSLGSARVQMQDRGAGFGGVDRLSRNLIGRDWQRFRHRRGVDRSCDRASYNEFVRHGSLSPSRPIGQ